jgi:hypothetical protein
MADQPRDSKGRWTKGRAGVVAVATAGVVAAGSTGIETGGAASVDSTTGQSLKSKTSSKEAARKGQREEAWKRMGLKAAKQFVKRELACTPYAFGQVQQFFLRTPCRSLDRMLLAIGDTKGNTVVVSVVWVRMPNEDNAGRLKQLIDIHGSGDVSPLAGAVLKLNGVHFAGDHYSSRRARSLVVIAETTSGGGRPSDAVLDDAADVAVEFPAP